MGWGTGKVAKKIKPALYLLAAIASILLVPFGVARITRSDHYDDY